MSFVRAQFVLPGPGAALPPAAAATLGRLGCPQAPRGRRCNCAGNPNKNFVDWVVSGDRRPVRIPARPVEPGRRPQNLRGLGFSIPWGTIIGAGTGAAIDILRSRSGGSSQPPVVETPGTFDANGNYVVAGGSPQVIDGAQIAQNAVQQVAQAGVQPVVYQTNPAAAANNPNTPTSLIPGVSNTTLAIGGAVGMMGLMMFMSKRR